MTNNAEIEILRGKKMNNNIKIVKLPHEADPNKIIQKKVREQNSVCPFCGEKRREDLLENTGNVGIRNSVFGQHWYGKHDGREHPFLSFFRFWEKDQSWSTSYYHCNACGGAWESEPYPLIDIKELI